MDVKRKIQGLFWASNEPAGASTTAGRAGAARDAAVPSAPAPAVSGAPLEADFAAIYARANSAGDPRVDQVLAAFEAMKAAMPQDQLAIALGATARAIGAERATIAETLARRLETLDAAVAAEQRGATQRRAARASELEAAASAARAEIQAAEARIAELRQRLASATASVQEQDAREQGLAAAFERLARDEAARLIALRDFFARSGPASSWR